MLCSYYSYSQTCHPMQKETQPEGSFIRVTCKSLPSSLERIIYRNLHLVANFPTEEKALAKKLEYWKRCKKDENVRCRWKKGMRRPPNVLLIGIDSTSRLNFHRHLPLSKILLETELGAIEMNGYTKGLCNHLTFSDKLGN